MIIISNNTEIYSDVSSTECLILQRGTGSVFEFECDERGKQFLKDLKKNKIQQQGEVVESLIELNILTRSESDGQLSTFDQAIKDMGCDPRIAAESIKKSKIAIIGLGTTGGWIAQQLSAVGISNFILIDPDVVSQSNLMRQPYRASDIGTKKIRAIQNWFSPQSSVETHDIELKSEADIPDSLKTSDLVLIAADKPSRAEMGRLIGDWCFRQSIPHIICGGYSGHNGACGVSVIPGKTPCWRCYLEATSASEQSIKKGKTMIGKGPEVNSGLIFSAVIGASASALEAFRLLLNKPPTLASRHLDINFEKWEIVEMKFQQNAKCKICGE